MSTLAEIRAQIAALQEQADEILTNERANVIGQIKQQIVDFGISATELGFTVLPPTSSRGMPSPSAEKIIKYRRDNDTWSGGRGPKPKWVQEVIASGEDIEQYRVS
ncbi:MAG: H-NS family nucleoid-associated regulatory protein [Leptothrix sp. (in: b-proteobacteria)]